MPSTRPFCDIQLQNQLIALIAEGNVEGVEKIKEALEKELNQQNEQMQNKLKSFFSPAKTLKKLQSNIAFTKGLVVKANEFLVCTTLNYNNSSDDQRPVMGGISRSLKSESLLSRCHLGQQREPPPPLPMTPKA